MTALSRGLQVARMLREGPVTPGDLARRLGVSRRTIDRILRTLETSGEPVTVRREGGRAYYSPEAQG